MTSTTMQHHNTNHYEKFTRQYNKIITFYEAK